VSHKIVKDTLAHMAKDVPNSDLQDAGKLCSALHACVSRIPHGHMKKVVRISICGQMHGIMFWKQGQGWRTTPRNGQEGQQVNFKKCCCCWKYTQTLHRIAICKLSWNTFSIFTRCKKSKSGRVTTYV
jgi:hypothetical protein